MPTRPEPAPTSATHGLVIRWSRLPEALALAASVIGVLAVAIGLA